MKFLTPADFHARANETFDLSLGESSMPLTLTEVQVTPQYAFSGQLRQPFSLIFRSASPVALPQKIYRLKNQTMGEVDIFLVPVGREVQGIVYQAVFN